MQRFLLISFLVGATGLIAPSPADEEYAHLRGKPIVVQEFSGSCSTTTGFFHVRDNWEVQWNARQVVSVAVMSSDGTIVAGAAGVLRGSLFIPLGGQYYLKISDGTVPDTSTPVAVKNSPPASTNSPSAVTDAPPLPNTNTPAAQTNAPANTPPAPALEIPPSWHLKIVQLGKSIHASQSLTVFTPYFIQPDSAVTPEPPPPPPPVLTQEQAQSIVRIRGDQASGTGFFLHTPDGNFVVTHLHVLAANPNVRLYTSAGAEIPTLGIEGATDRDLVTFTIKNQGYNLLPSYTDSANKIITGESLIIPDIAGQSDPMLGKPGRVIGINADHVDFDNSMRPDSSGAPVILARKGTALAIVTAVKKADLSDKIAAAWPANPPPGSSGVIPYFGLRLNGVPSWEAIDPKQFLAETTFLKQFHRDTRCLDSFLNGRKHRDRGEDEDTGAPDIHFYLNSTKIHSAFDTYRQFANGADYNQRMEAAHEFLFDLYGITNADVATLQGMTNLYSYDQNWAKEELAYRAAIKKKLDDLGNNLGDLDTLARERLQP